MRIAINIDRTAYDTKWCIADLHRQVKRLPIEERLQNIKELSDKPETFYHLL